MNFEAVTILPMLPEAPVIQMLSPVEQEIVNSYANIIVDDTLKLAYEKRD